MHRWIHRLIPAPALALLTGLALQAADSQRSPAPSTPPAAARRNVLVLGDSLAAGYGVDPSESFPVLLQRRVDAAQLPFTVINAGLSGDTSAGGLRRIDWLTRRPVDVLLLELGGNDGLRGIGVASTRTNLQGIIDKTRARHPGVRVVIAGMQMPPNMGEEFTAKFRDLFPELAKANQAALVPFLLEGVGGKPELNLPDMVHPTPKGHELLASNVWQVLEPVLRSVTNAVPSPPAH